MTLKHKVMSQELQQLFSYSVSLDKTHTKLWEAVWAIIHNSLWHTDTLTIYVREWLHSICKRLWLCMYEWVSIMAQTASHTTLIQCPWAKHHSWASLYSLLDTQPLVSCRSYSDAHSQRHVFFLFFCCRVKTMCSDSEKKKICNRSVKWNLSLRLLFVHVRSMPLGNRTHVLVRCCVPNKDHPSSTLLHPIYWFWTMIIKIRLSLKWEDVLVMFFLCCVLVRLYNNIQQVTLIHKKIHLSRITNQTLHSKWSKCDCIVNICWSRAHRLFTR